MKVWRVSYKQGCQMASLQQMHDQFIDDYINMLSREFIVWKEKQQNLIDKVSLTNPSPGTCNTTLSLPFGFRTFLNRA
jgi:hypothetical protein